MSSRAPLQRWLIAFAVAVAAVMVCYFWIDRPLALYAHTHLRRFDIFDQLTWIAECLKPAGPIVLIVAGLRSLAPRPLARWEAVVLLCALSLVAADAVTDLLKLTFGRTWPETWTGDNPSFIRDGVSHFNFFHGGRGYASFPSGHTTVVAAPMTVVWLCWPRLRALAALCILAEVTGLLGADYHFLSDVIAGAFVGGSGGWMAVRAWDAHVSAPPLRPG